VCYLGNCVYRPAHRSHSKPCNFTTSDIEIDLPCYKGHCIDGDCIAVYNETLHGCALTHRPRPTTVHRSDDDDDESRDVTTHRRTTARSRTPATTKPTTTTKHHTPKPTTTARPTTKATTHRSRTHTTAEPSNDDDDDDDEKTQAKVHEKVIRESGYGNEWSNGERNVGWNKGGHGEWKQGEIVVVHTDQHKRHDHGKAVCGNDRLDDGEECDGDHNTGAMRYCTEDCHLKTRFGAIFGIVIGVLVLICVIFLVVRCSGMMVGISGAPLRREKRK
jgi:hypothetical protein